MPDENEQKPSKINWIMLMLIIVCLAVIVFMLIIALGKANNTQPEVPENQPSEANGGKSQIEVEPISDEKSSADNTAINESVESQTETDIEKIKMDIITGKTRDVPAGLNLTSRAIIRDYLSDCHMIEDLCKSLGCYELYFLNNDASLKQQKDSCEALSGNERTNCLDQYYFHMGTWERGIFCEAITNPDLMTECVNTAV